MLSSNELLEPPEGRRDDLYPCPLPYGLEWDPPRSHRRRRRWLLEWQTSLTVTLVIAHHNWCALGQPLGVEPALRLPPAATAAQVKLVARVRLQVDAGLRRRIAPWCGRRKTLHKVLLELNVGSYDGGRSADGGPAWLTAENASLPRRAATVPLDGPATHPLLAKLYAQPHAFDKAAADLPRQVPRACSRVKRWPELARRAASTCWSYRSVMLPSLCNRFFCRRGWAT